MIYSIFEESTTPGICWGGGGSSGGVDFPEHMKDVHKDWLGYTVGSVGSPITKDLITVMNTALSTNPLQNVEFIDPASLLNDVFSEQTSLDTHIKGLNPSTEVDDAIAKAVLQADTAGVLNKADILTAINSARTGTAVTLNDMIEKSLAAIDGTLLTKAVNGFVASRRKDRAQMRTRYKSGMVNVGAERSSAYQLGLALLEVDFERELTQYQTELSLSLYSQGMQAYLTLFQAEVSSYVQAELTDKQARDNLMTQSAGWRVSYSDSISKLRLALHEALLKSTQIAISADQDFVANTADINRAYSAWDMEVFSQGINILGGMGGGTLTNPRPSKTSSVIGGVLSGAGTGAAVGGPWGAAIGAVVGGIAGAT